MLSISSDPRSRWKWLSMKPGSSVRPAASMMRVFEPRQSAASAALPT
jgi:hypothetical protein